MQAQRSFFAAFWFCSILSLSKGTTSSSAYGPGGSSFSNLVKLLVRQMAIEHPFHVLPQLFALVNGDDYGPGSGVQVPVMTSRIEIAHQILESIGKQPDWATMKHQDHTKVLRSAKRHRLHRHRARVQVLANPIRQKITHMVPQHVL